MLKRIRPIARMQDRCLSDPATNGESRFAGWLVPKCDVVFDVGARTDDYLVQLNTKAEFHLFEPMSASFAELCRKTSGNSRVSVINTALGYEIGEYLLYPDTQSIHKRPHGTVEPIHIQVDRLDDYCDRNNVQSIDFMKIDVEGHELEVMKGGHRMIRDQTKTIQFEYGGTFREVGLRLADVFDFLGEGWHHYAVRPNGLSPIKNYSQSLENYEYANYVASRLSLTECLAPAMTWSRRIRNVLERRAG